ncbi:MAG: type IV pilus twitching motility protein PilT [Candidatus Pacebacteria bacterium]|nr:type IV pilus twitching motility protein PilT [Candidatus Paceibacterota bacterium]
MTIEDLLNLAFTEKASDLHLVVDLPPILRVNGVILTVPNEPLLTTERNEELIFSLFTEEQKETFLINKEIDFSVSLKDLARFRVNAYYEKGRPAASLRLIPNQIIPIDDLGLPKISHDFAKLKQGLILVTGPTGHGKSTTLAAIIDEINELRREHIVTIEDPIEYVHHHKKSIISQRELRSDTHSWEIALRSVLREDPNIVLIGEMRDYETIAAALTIAETGHLVFATLHTNSAAQTVDRIVDVFPPHQQQQVRTQLAFVLEAIVSQRLIPSLDESRVVACEILLANSAVRNSVREGQTHLIDNIIQTSIEMGMITLEMDLARLVKTGKISYEQAKNFALRPKELVRQVSRLKKI